MRYRADIQILRGLAVILVVIFHLQLGLLHSGFLGVDIFFVISGFLMAVLYQRSDDQNAKTSALDWPSVKAFWTRRARRILPAYYAVILITLVASYFLLYPSEYLVLNKHIRSSSLLIPNFNYWLEDNYFDEHYFRPLLHLWSLGIEAQFYFIVPLLVYLFNRSKKAFIALTIASFILSLMISGRASTAAFFLLPTRLWEFLIGFLCAKFLTQHGNIIKHKGIYGLAALLFILFLCAFDYGIYLREMRHPGFIALIACICSVVILMYGLPDRLSHSYIGKLFQRIGELSYSIYIVHYPIILLSVYKPFYGTYYNFTYDSKLALIVAAIIVFSLVFYYLIETPLRKINDKTTPKLMLILTALCLLGSYFLESQQRKSYTDKQLKYFDAVTDRNEFRCGELYNLTHLLSYSCPLNNPHAQLSSEHKRYLLIGDSHADAIKKTLSQVINKNGDSLRMVRHNFAVGVGILNAQDITDEALKYKIDAVILHSSPNHLNMTELKKLVVLAEQYEFTIHYIDPVPTWVKSVPELLWLKDQTGKEFEKMDISAYKKQNWLELDMLQNLNSPVLKRYSPADYLCDEQRCLQQDENGYSIYYDSHHLSITGSKKLIPLFDKIVSNLK